MNPTAMDVLVSSGTTIVFAVGAASVARFKSAAGPLLRAVGGVAMTLGWYGFVLLPRAVGHASLVSVAFPFARIAVASYLPVACERRQGHGLRAFFWAALALSLMSRWPDALEPMLPVGRGVWAMVVIFGPPVVGLAVARHYTKSARTRFFLSLLFGLLFGLFLVVSLVAFLV